MPSLRRYKTIAGAMLLLGPLIFAPATVFALTSWYGNNHSYDWGGAYGVGVCDGETDGNPAYVRYEAGGRSYRVDDANGSQPGCTDHATGYRVYRHHVCEGRAWGSDPCGPWVYP